MITKFSEMLKEGGVYSFTRFLIVVGYIAFLIGSAYLIYKGLTWGNYETFATMTGGGSGALQAVNKFINSKFNTNPGEVGKKIGSNG
ncbi:hypothetical protein [Phascolarctobacterium sp.]|uniref:hypothetical protein n=1 Tax=Phascolarctobacterium sp. TaxID=2049039 RepID=UPI0030786E49